MNDDFYEQVVAVIEVLFIACGSVIGWELFGWWFVIPFWSLMTWWLWVGITRFNAIIRYSTGRSFTELYDRCKNHG